MLRAKWFGSQGEVLHTPSEAALKNAGANSGAVQRALEPFSVLSALPFTVLAIDREYRIRYVNGSGEQFFSRAATSLTGLSLKGFFPVDSALLALITQVLSEGASVVEYDVTLNDPKSRQRNLAITVSPVTEDLELVVVTLHEQSIARRIRSQMVHRNTARSITGLAALMAHEVKNPLSGIRGAAQLLETTLDSQEDIALTRMICEETDRICHLVDRMDFFSGGSPSRSAVNIHLILERVCRIAEVGFGRHVRFIERYDPSLPPVYGNPDQLLQVFLNLVKNACEAMSSQNAEIRLGTSYQHGFRLALPGGTHRVQLPLMVSVADNGPGIPEDLAAHLFDPFVTSRIDGSGLGLALVAKVIGDHGGSVEFDTGDRGTEFRVRLPMCPEPDQGAK